MRAAAGLSPGPTGCTRPCAESATTKIRHRHTGGVNDIRGHADVLALLDERVKFNGSDLRSGDQTFDTAAFGFVPGLCPPDRQSFRLYRQLGDEGITLARPQPSFRLRGAALSWKL